MFIGDWKARYVAGGTESFWYGKRTPDISKLPKHCTSSATHRTFVNLPNVLDQGLVPPFNRFAVVVVEAMTVRLNSNVAYSLRISL